MARASVRQRIHSFDLDVVQDMLFIEFEPIAVETYYTDVNDDRDVMRRFTDAADRFVGISMVNAVYRLGSEKPRPEAIRQFAEQLVARYG